jgi:hypothetical protein
VRASIKGSDRHVLAIPRIALLLPGLLVIFSGHDEQGVVGVSLLLFKVIGQKMLRKKQLLF